MRRSLDFIGWFLLAAIFAILIALAFWLAFSLIVELDQSRAQ
jgi:hypothetical protein